MVSSRDGAKSEILRIVSAQTLRGACHFLVAEQESNQRSRLGRGTDREAYRYFLGFVPFLPRLQAVLSQDPLPAPVVTWPVVEDLSMVREKPPLCKGGCLFA